MRFCCLDDADLPNLVAEIVHASLKGDAHKDWPLGRTDLEQGCYVNVEDGETRAAASARFEAHNRYVDIQLVIAGAGECMEWISRDVLSVSEDLLDENDLLFFAEPEDRSSVQRLVVRPQHLAVFMPLDAHKPSLHLAAETDAAQTPSQRRKYVYKIPVSLFAAPE